MRVICDTCNYRFTFLQGDPEERFLPFEVLTIQPLIGADPLAHFTIFFKAFMNGLFKGSLWSTFFRVHEICFTQYFAK